MKQTSICLFCKNEFTYDDSRSTGKYCSNRCQMNFQKIENSKSNREKFEKGTLSNRKIIKIFLTEDRGYKCEICNINTWADSPIQLQVDHIDGNSDNNLPSNVRLLCPNCHSQTPTYKGGNKKSLKTDSRSVMLRKRYASMKDLKRLELLNSN